jgi:hypothetical protein
LALSYFIALSAVVGLFLAYRIHSHHATFAQRQFFWMGNVHEAAPMGFRMRPGVTGYAVLNYGLRDPARQIPVHTDQRGFRVPLGRDSTLIASNDNAPKGIAAIGCSCTFGHGVAAESTYVAQAGALLDIPAYNLGVCGYSSITSLLLLKDEAATLHPRYVVYGFGNFHLERSGRPRADSQIFQAYARCEEGLCRIEPPAFDNRLVFEMAPRIETLYYGPRLAGRETPLDLARLRALLPLAGQDLVRALHPRTLALRFERPALPETTFCRFLLGELQQTCRQNDAILVLLWFPAFFGDRPAPGLTAAVQEMSRAPDFVYVDCSERLFAAVHDQAEYSQRWQVPRDGHPNRFMHQAMAEALATALGPTPGASP